MQQIVNKRQENWLAFLVSEGLKAVKKICCLPVNLLNSMLLLGVSFHSLAQTDSTVWVTTPPPHYSFVRYNENVINEKSALDSFYYKLSQLKNSGKGSISIVHIGDSHLQADMMTSVLRDGFREYFGDAGRGVIFPYQVANSNGPKDLTSHSNQSWKTGRITSSDKVAKCGIMGYVLEAPSDKASINIHLKDKEGKQEKFNRLVFFLCNDSVCYKVSDTGLNAPIIFNTKSQNKPNCVAVNTDSFVSGFELARITQGKGNYEFYGVSLEKKDAAGVIYHTIGVNGARYDQYAADPIFWDQLKELKADLVVVSMGTNEAQNPYISEEAMLRGVDSFFRQLAKVAPNVPVLITTPCGSYFRQKSPNKGVDNVSRYLYSYAVKHKHAVWDMYNIGGGMQGIPSLKKFNLIAHDLVHYNQAGYELQGLLLLNAMAAGYNIYQKAHPYKPKKVLAPAPPPVKVVAEVEKPKVTKVQDEIVKPHIIQVGANIPVKKDTVKPTIGLNPPVPTPPPPHKSNIQVTYEN